MRRTTLALLALMLAAPPLAAQSLFSASGLGYPMTPTDGRAALLGGTGVGLLGLNTSLINPAEPAELTRRGLVAGLAGSDRDVSLDGVEGELGSTRFPLLRVLYPIGSGTTLSLGFGAFLDQAYALERQTQVVLGADVFDATDQLISTGGVAQLRLGVARTLTESLAVGLAVGLYTGNQQVRFIRRFEDPDGVGLADLDGRVSWDYSAPLVSAGVRWDPLDILRVGASVTWSGELSADSSFGPAVSRELSLPLEVAAGTSAYLAEGLLAALSARWSGWSAAAGDVAVGVGAAEASDAWALGGGIEWTGSGQGRLRFPLRLGAQWRQLPFGFAAGTPTEWAAGVGAGMRVGGTAANPLASLDAGLERGVRSEEASLEETFWRLNLSLSVFGN